MDRLVSALWLALVAMAGLVFVFLVANLAVDHFPSRIREKVRPWIFVGPGLVLVAAGLLWPALTTTYMTFHAGRSGTGALTLNQWAEVFGNPDNFNVDHWQRIFLNPLFLIGCCVVAAVVVAGLVSRLGGKPSGIDRKSPIVVIAVASATILLAFGVTTTLQGVIWVNLWWMVTVPIVTTLLGFIFAMLADGRRGEPVAKAMLFMPMAVSLVGAGVIWRFVYYRNTSRESIGLVNTILNAVGLPSVDFYNGSNILPWNNLFIMVIVIWILTGFAVVTFSAAIKSVPDEQIEAARVDGASGFDVAWHVVLPCVRGTTIVVATTIVIFVTKIFDIIKATTNGASGTEVLGLAVFRNLSEGNFARSAVFAVIILALVMPAMAYNLREQLRS